MHVFFDLYIWTITSGMNVDCSLIPVAYDAISAHVVVIDRNRSKTILQEINAILERNAK